MQERLYSYSKKSQAANACKHYVIGYVIYIYRHFGSCDWLFIMEACGHCEKIGNAFYFLEEHLWHSCSVLMVSLQCSTLPAFSSKNYTRRCVTVLTVHYRYASSLFA